MGDAFGHDLLDLLTSTLRSSLLGIIASHSYPLLLLERDTDLARALAGTGVGASALTAAGETLAVTHATIGAEVDQTLDRQLDFTTQVAFDRDLRNGIADAFEFGVGKILDLLGIFDAAGIENLRARGRPMP